MEKKYKICFFGYGKLIKLAQKIIADYTFEDTSITIKECSYLEVPAVLNDTLYEGYDIFIAGPAAANLIRFPKQVVELKIDTIDYIYALKAMERKGYKRPAIVIYDYCPKVDIQSIESVLGYEVQLIEYEDHAGLKQILQESNIDVVIGAAFPNKVAEELNIHSHLIYSNGDSIRVALDKARQLAIENENLILLNSITNTLIQHSPNGIIVTDTSGTVTTMNEKAKDFASLNHHMIGKNIADISPALSFDVFRYSDLNEISRKRIINGTMLQCTQTYIGDYHKPLGLLVTLYPDNARKMKGKGEAGESYPAEYHWNNIDSQSPAMRDTIYTLKGYAGLHYPITLLGEPGTGKRRLAQCIHNTAHSADAPYLVYNAASIADPDAARTLFGVDDGSSMRLGLFDMACNGTLVIQNLHLATKAVQSCFLQVLGDKKYYRCGGFNLVPMRARLIFLLPDDSSDMILPELWYKITILKYQVPALKERREDIEAIFSSFLSAEFITKSIKKNQGIHDLLLFYSWPGNLTEMSNVSKRMAILLKESVKASASEQLLYLVNSIGEQNLLQDIFLKYPALANIENGNEAEIKEGITSIKKYLKYNNAKIASLLKISRTTMWRMFGKKKNEALSDEIA